MRQYTGQVRRLRAVRWVTQVMVIGPLQELGAGFMKALYHRRRSPPSCYRAIMAALIRDTAAIAGASRRHSPAVRVLHVNPGGVRMVVHAQGTVSPRTEADLVPEVSGNVVWISPNLVAGGYFEEGEPLLRIDERDYRYALERARAAVDRAMAEQEFAAFELRRLREMEAGDLISRSEVESGARTARVTEAALADARATLKQANRLSRTEITAAVCRLWRTSRSTWASSSPRGAIAQLYAVD